MTHPQDMARHVAHAAATVSRQSILKAIHKRFGLVTAPETVAFLQQVLVEAETAPEDVDECVANIVEAVLRHSADGNINDISALEAAVKKFYAQLQMVEAVADGGGRVAGFPRFQQHEFQQQKLLQYLHVISAFEVPRYRYDRQHHLFLKVEDPPLSLLDNPERKVDMFRYRFDMIKQKIMRNDNFKPPAFARSMVSEDASHAYLKITAIKNLLGCEGQSFLLLGMLSQLKQGQLFLEDLDAEVELELEEDVETGRGIYTETCFVLASGTYLENGKFRVRELGMPPPEERQISLSANKLVNFFGGPVSELSLEMNQVEENEETIFIVISDVWLDQPRVLEKLEKLFQGYTDADVVPAAFILMGDFLSEPFAHDGIMSTKYKEAFVALTELVLKFPAIARLSHFILVPGPNDPWGGNILPKPGLPKLFAEKLRNKLGNVTLATNPCRIKFCTREIVVFREDLLAKMQRNALLKPNLDQEPFLYRHLLYTLINQSHLCPLPLGISPTYWAHDHALQLYPNPDVLILGDRHDPYETTFAKCLCFNPGPFTVTHFQFMVYFPATNSVEVSQLD